MIKHQLEKDIDVLVENQLISTEQSVKIKEFYSKSRKPTLESSMLLPLIGVLLIGAGFIALCASNWEYMSDGMRLVVAFIPLSILDFYLFKYKDHKSEVLIQCLTFGVAFALLFAFGIVTNVFQTPVSTDILIHLGLFCVLPLVYVFDAYWLGVITIMGGIATCADEYLILSTIGLISLVPYCYFKFKANQNFHIMVLLHMVVLFRLSHLVYDGELTLFIPLAILLVIGLFYRTNVYTTTTKIMFYMVGIAFSLDDGIISIAYDIDFIAVSFYFIMLLGAAYYTIKYLTGEENLTHRYFNLHSISILMLVAMDFLGAGFHFLATALMLYIFGFNAFYHFKNFNIKGYNRYSFIFSCFILAKMTSLDFPFMVQGILFIVLGVIFIYLSHHITNLIKAQQLSEGVISVEEFTQQ